MRRTLALFALLLAACGDPATTSDAPATTSDVVDVVDVGEDVALADSSVARDSAVAEDTGEDAATDTGEDTAIDTAAQDAGDACCDAADTVPDVSDPYAGLDSVALRAALHTATLIGHTPLGYNDARDAMYAVGGVDDVGGGRIEAIYTGRTVDANGSRTPNKNCALADGTPTSCRLNTEHTFARYFLDLALSEGSQDYWAAEGDIHHIFPCDEDVNSARWHFDFGDTRCHEDGDCKVDEESRLGQRDGVSGFANCPTGDLDYDHVCVMQVRPARQGDVARGLFYMAVRYDMHLDDEMEAALRAWSHADPPDERERSRDDAIEAAQGNRNPFVDRPELVDRVEDF